VTARIEIAGDAVRRAAGDFGGIIQRRPWAVVRARSIADVVDAVKLAASEGVQVVARGQGHTTRGQAQVDGGIVVDMTALDSIAIDGRTAIAGAGARWDALLRTSAAHDLAPATLTDYLGLTIGGTLSVGGIGGQSFRHGLQTDLVDELVVVTGRAEVVTCSRAHARDLFDACRGGLGQCAIIVRATLRLIDAPRDVVVLDLPYGDAESFLGAQLQLADDGRFDYLRGYIVPTPNAGWRYAIEAVSGPGIDEARLLEGLALAGSPSTRRCSYLEFALRLDAMVAAMKAAGTWTARHPWLDLFVPASATPAVIQMALGLLAPAEIEDGHLMTYPLVRKTIDTPLVDVGEDRAFLFDILPNLPGSDPARLADLEARFAAVVERAREVGARVYPIGYPVGTPRMTERDWQRQFQRAWPSFAEAKRRHDPEHLLSPGPGIFSADGVPRAAQPTLGRIGVTKLSALATAAGVDDDLDRAIDLFSILSAGWSRVPVGRAAPWKNDLTDDGTPFELSLALGTARTELRLLVEPQRLPVDAQSGWREGLSVNQELQRRHGVDLSAFATVQELFAPPSSDASVRFSLWHAAALHRDATLLKVYVNPEIRGPEQAPRLVAEALERLGLVDAWSFLAPRRGTALPYFSVDLAPDPRVKIYVAYRVAASAVDEILRGCENHRDGDVEAWVRQLVGHDGTLAARPLLACFAFPRRGGAPDVTVHVPIRCHARDDGEALRRTASLLAPSEHARLEAGMTAIADRPLDRGRGLLTYVSMRRQRDLVRVTAYLAPETHTHHD
jgi:DMATS type aromatic prenyltransferase